MILFDVQRKSSDMCTTRICIDSYINGEMHGRVCSIHMPKPVKFSNVVTLLRALESLHDNCEYPQSAIRRRHFGAEAVQDSYIGHDPDYIASREAIETVSNARGEQATFGVRLMFRQNASWQGVVIWLEKNQKVSFRSALELIMLMDSSFEDRTKSAGFDVDQVEAM